ncbi:MAG TPA: hypothetical protein VHH09_01010 [Acidimicrobiales bacterium]|nr:hypothetical protein [Acidimicrobiales bacterium]
MARQRFVLRYLGPGAKPAADVAAVRALEGVAVVDESARMLLVETDEEAVPGLAEALPGWVVGPEQRYDVPDTRKML